MTGLNRERLIHVIQGEYAVSDDSNSVITTLLGSCVSACLWDESSAVGGLNHIVLPDGGADSAQAAYLGVNAMELLINDLTKIGAQRARLKAKLFGGARMIAGLSDVGARNARFVEEFLERENIPVLSQSLGGTSARKIQFWPTTGRARQLLLGSEAIKEELPPPVVAPSSDIELF